jgi:hypothetical protein
MRIRFATGIATAALCLAFAGTGRSGDPVTSGLKIGESVSPFNVDDITGPNKGNTLCYR